MKKLITATAAATLLLAAPLAFAHGDDHHGWKNGHYRPWYGPTYVERVYYPAPRVVVPQPVYVPAPVVAVPVPAPVALPAPYPYPPQPVGSVNIGFRLFF